MNEQHRLRRLELLNKQRRVVAKAPCYLPAYLLQCPTDPGVARMAESMQCPVPPQLPPLSPYTISLYRRAGRPVWLTRGGATEVENLHLLHESLWMLTLAKEEQYGADYAKVAAEFERDLGEYLGCGWKDIAEMAIIAAGNRVLGSQPLILAVSQQHFWVLGNHISEGKIAFECLFEWLLQDRPEAYQTLYELSESPVTSPLLRESEVLSHIVGHLNGESSPQLSLSSLRIVGNLLFSSEQFVDELIRLGVVRELEQMLRASQKRRTKEEICWALSNIAFGSSSQATHLLHHPRLLSKLMALLCAEGSSVREEILQVFTGLVSKGEPASVFRLLQTEELLKCLADQRSTPELQDSLARIVAEIVQLVRGFVDEHEWAGFAAGLKRHGLEDYIPEQQGMAVEAE